MSHPNSSGLGSKRFSFTKPVLCYVTDRRTIPDASERDDLLERLLEKVETVATAGVDWIQLREKDLSGKDCAWLAQEALARVLKKSSCPQTAARIVVNDRLDVALAQRAGGAHLGESSIPVGEAKRLVEAVQTTGPHNFLLGVSCHSLGAAKSAASSGADYIFFGPVFATPSKTPFGAPQGLERLAQVCESVRIPVLAIGGITLRNAASCFSNGASGIAGIRLFQDSNDPTSVINALRHARF